MSTSPLSTAITFSTPSTTKYFSKMANLSNAMHDIIFPFMNIALLKKEDDLIYPNSFVTNKQLESLNKAHAITETLYSVLLISRSSKEIYATFNAIRNNLIDRIVTIMTKLHEGPRGAKCLRECVDTGLYLKVLRVYFFYKPTALLNYSEENRQEGFNRTILHNSVVPNVFYDSTNFVRFILEIDKQYGLKLCTSIDSEKETPLMRIQRSKKSEPYECREKIEKLLTFYTSTELEPNQAPTLSPVIAITDSQHNSNEPAPSSSPPAAASLPPPVEEEASSEDKPNEPPASSSAPAVAALPPPVEEEASSEDKPNTSPPLAWHQTIRNFVFSCFLSLWDNLLALFRRLG